jgi:ribosomal-protein-alanine N-acetyltransferase
MTTTTTKPGIRWMIRKDMPDVLRIEAACFGHSGWTEGDFVEQLRQRNTTSYVVLDGQRVVGYILLHLRHDHISLLNFAVDPAYRRRGYGRALIEKLKSKINANSHSRGRFVTYIPEENLPAQLFLRACGIGCFGLRSYTVQGHDEKFTDYKFVYKGA